MALAGFGIEYRAKLIPFGEPHFSQAIAKHSKAGLVPVLKHNGLVIWDTLAIMEYLAETYPRKGMWPKDKAARAMARSISAEMHSGFRALRNDCPMNIRRAPKPVPFSPKLLKDVARIEQVWADARRKYGKGGPFLFGKFSLADAMYAPVCSRLETFKVPVSAASRRYMDAVLGSAAFQAWKTLAL
jgi:glutathione S-transferase